MRKKTLTKKTSTEYETPLAELTVLDLVQSIMVGSSFETPETYEEGLNINDFIQ